MAVMMTCDACGAELGGPDDRTQVVVPSDGTVAGAMVDLCRACAKNVIADPQVKKGAAAFTKRRQPTTPPKPHAPSPERTAPGPPEPADAP